MSDFFPCEFDLFFPSRIAPYLKTKEHCLILKVGDGTWDAQMKKKQRFFIVFQLFALSSITIDHSFCELINFSFLGEG